MYDQECDKERWIFGKCIEDSSAILKVEIETVQHDISWLSLFELFFYLIGSLFHVVCVRG